MPLWPNWLTKTAASNGDRIFSALVVAKRLLPGWLTTR